MIVFVFMMENSYRIVEFLLFSSVSEIRPWIIMPHLSHGHMSFAYLWAAKIEGLHFVDPTWTYEYDPSSKS
jgi:hypothetical protein